MRALNPWPVSYTLLEGKVLKLWQTKKVTGFKKAEPGTIIDVQEEGFVVATGNDTSILIQELQPSGKKKMSARDYLRGAGSFIQTGMAVGEENEAN